MKKTILLTITLSVLLMAMAIAQDKKTVIKKVVVTATSLNARTGPTVKHFPLGLFPRDTVLNVYEVKNDWYKTDCPANAKIYISLKYIKVKGDNGVIQGSNVNGRSRPDAQSVVCFKFQHKTKVTVIGQKNDWIQIAPPKEAFAWISGKPNFVKTINAGNVGLLVNNNKPIIKENVTKDPTDINDLIDKQPGVTKDNPKDGKVEDIIQENDDRKIAAQKEADKQIKLLLEKKTKKMKKGWVKRLGRVIGRKATHALYITEGQILYHLISRNPSIKLEDYASKFVGVLGEDAGKEKRSKVRLISVTEIKIFKDKEPTIKLKEKEPKK